MNMTTILQFFSVVIFMVVILGFINEKTVKITDEIALLLFSMLLTIVLIVLKHMGILQVHQHIENVINSFNLNSYLVDGVLCFMLFAGASNIRMKEIEEDFKLITCLSLLTTMVGAVIYGVLFFLFAKLIGIDITFPMCLVFGSIISPTDPIAATSILQKFGLPKRTGIVIESESLFNDGVGVALFVCFSRLVTHSKGENFLVLMCREVLGALAIGIVIGFLTFLIFKNTKDIYRQIFVSLFAVSATYSLCQLVQCSGAIAVVVCGICYSTKIRKIDQDLTYYKDFWSVVDHLLNSVLYVIIGAFASYVFEMPCVAILSAGAVIINLAARGFGVAASLPFNRPLPDRFTPMHFTALLTWGGLRGGLCLALALSTAKIFPTNIFHIVVGCTYAAVFFTTVIQGLTMSRVYQKIKM